MVIVAMAGNAKKVKKHLANDARWCYLGKDISKIEDIARILGAGKRFYLKDGLQKKAEMLKQPFIDFVASRGKIEKDRLNWWAGKFASKSHLQTDFFLLLCYKSLAIELIANENRGTLVIFIEDPWLFADIRSAVKGKNIGFSGSHRLSLIRFSLVLRGIARRLLLVVWFYMAYLSVFIYHRGEKPAALKKQKSAVLILNPAEMRAFDKNGRYVNSYMPGLPELYEENKIPFFHLYMLRFSRSAAKYIGRNRERLWPLIYDVRAGEMIKRIFQRWKLALNNDVPNIGPHDVSTLLDREKWLEFSSVGFNFHLILFDTLDRFFKRGWCRTIVYVFENQPWEKMLCMAARKNGIRLIGYQHSAISRLYVSQFIGKGEDALVPLPDKICTAGEHFADLYREGCMPEDKIIVSGAWRYLHVLDGADPGSCKKNKPDQKQTVLIALNMDISVANSMLENFCKVINRDNLDEKMEFWIKTHPGNIKGELNRLSKLASGFRIVSEPFNKLLKKVDIVVSSGSVSGLEAFLYGKKVVLYIPENLLAADSLLDMDDPRIYKWYEGEDIDTGFLTDFSPADPQALSTIKKRYFSRIDRDAWLKHVTI